MSNAGCALVCDPEKLRAAFAYHPPYYHFSEEGINYFDYGLQNSRGFRALKVWLALRQAGSSGYLRMIADDMQLARRLFSLVGQHPDFDAMTQHLSIATFRYVPRDLRSASATPETEAYLQRLNEDLLTRVERSGEAFLSSAIVNGRFALRACIVNFRTSLAEPLAASFRDAIDLFGQLLGDQRELSTGTGLAEVVKQSKRSIRDGNRQLVEYSMTYRLAGGRTVNVAIRVDPATRLPETATIQPQEGPELHCRFDYPEFGPEDLNSLGVPKDAPVVDRVPAADAVNARARRTGRQFTL